MADWGLWVVGQWMRREKGKSGAQDCSAGLRLALAGQGPGRSARGHDPGARSTSWGLCINAKAGAQDLEPGLPLEATRQALPTGWGSSKHTLTLGSAPAPPLEGGRLCILE